MCLWRVESSSCSHSDGQNKLTKRVHRQQTEGGRTAADAGQQHERFVADGRQLKWRGRWRHSGLHDQRWRHRQQVQYGRPVPAAASSSVVMSREDNGLSPDCNSTESSLCRIVVALTETICDYRWHNWRTMHWSSRQTTGVKISNSVTSRIQTSITQCSQNNNNCMFFAVDFHNEGGCRLAEFSSLPAVFWNR